MKTKYFAEWRYGPHLAQVIVSTETPKSFRATIERKLMGHPYVGSRTNKARNIKLCDTFDEAKEWLTKKATDNIEDKQERLNDALKLREEIRMLDTEVINL